MSADVWLWVFPCPRCGAEVDSPCVPVRPGKWPTKANVHDERGLSPSQLSERGYEAEWLVDGDGFQVTLWRKPGTPRVTIPGFERQPEVDAESTEPEGSA